MNFLQRPKAKTTMTYDARITPVILIKEDALNKMFIYVDECKDEIGWLGTASYDKDAHIYTIHDVYLFEQEVHATTTEITPEGLAQFGTELLEQEGGMDIWNNIRMWGHSHVNMGVSPSGQDDKQMREFGNIGQDWFIRLICNKKGEMKVDLYNYEAGLTFFDVAWEIADGEESGLTEELRLKMLQLETWFKSQMDILQTQLDSESTAKVDAIKEEIKTEMKDKVSKISYVTKSTGGKYDYSKHYLTHPLITQHGRNIGQGWKNWTTFPPTEEEVRLHSKEIPIDVLQTYYDDNKKKVEHNESGNNVPGDDSVLENKQHVYSFLKQDDLRELGFCRNTEELKDNLEEFGYIDTFSRQDLNLIWEVVQAEQDAYDEWYGLGGGVTYY